MSFPPTLYEREALEENPTYSSTGLSLLIIIMALTLTHGSLQAVLKGTEVRLDQTAVQHYRGIQYGKIPQRFAKAVPVDNWSGATLDCTRFG